MEAIRGESLLEQVIARPESTTLVYVHPGFTVRETVWAPLEEPALLVFLDVDSEKPLTISFKFVPDFKPMWPASLGGQYSYWLAESPNPGLGGSFWAVSRPRGNEPAVCRRYTRAFAKR